MAETYNEIVRKFIRLRRIYLSSEEGPEKAKLKKEIEGLHAQLQEMQAEVETYLRD